MAFPENLRNAREQKKMSQAELADKLGISQKAIYSYEKGTRTPNFILGCKISEVLNIPAETLVNGTDDSNTDSI